MSNLIFKALKNNYRYPTAKGLVTTEDLMDMPLKSAPGHDLNSVAQILHDEIQATSSKIDFVSKKKASNKLLEEKMEIVMMIIEDKIADQEAAKNAKALKERREQLLELKKNKELEAAGEMSLEDIEKELRTLGED